MPARGTSKNSSYLDEHHEFQFRGVWVPPDLMEAFARGELTSDEILLILIIDGLVKSKGDGCWASDKHLAAKIHASPRHTSRLIRKLIKLDLLVKKGYTKRNGRNYRLLETTWSRIGSFKRTSYDTHVIGGQSCVSGRVKTEIQDEFRTVDTEAVSTARSEESQLPGRGKKMGMFSRMTEMGLKAPTTPDKKERTSAGPIDRAMAEQLRKAVAQKTQRTFRFHREKWAKEFRLLRESMDDDQGRLERVTDWFCAHITDRYTPVVACAKTFRAKFDQIEAAMLRECKDAPVEISPEAQAIAKEFIQSKVWPGGSGVEVPALVEITLRSFRDFRSRLTKYCEANPPVFYGKEIHKRDKNGFKYKTRKAKNNLPKYKTAHFVLAFLGTSQHMTRLWIDQVHNSIFHWRERKKELSFFAFKGQEDWDKPQFANLVLKEKIPSEDWTAIKNDLRFL